MRYKGIHPCKALIVYLVIASGLSLSCIAFSGEIDRPGVNFSGYLNPKGPLHDKVIVFIHGIFGSPESTWLNTRSSAHWPKLIASDQELNKFDVYVVKYHTPYTTRTGTIHEIATQLLWKLKDDDVFHKHKQMYFVTHSMGGLIAKSMLIDLNRVNPSELENL